MQLSDRDIERFWSKVDRRGPDECWPWKGGRRKAEYGGFKIGGVFELAIRVAFLLANGYLPTVVRHTCDHPPCVNPAHLRPGTHAENMADAARRERWPHMKLTGDDVRAIRRSDERGVDAARRYRVSKSLISMIRSGKARRHVGPVA